MRKWYKILWGLTLIVSSMFFLMSCSTKTAFFNRLKLWDESQTKAEEAKRDLTRFASTVRPPRGNPDSHHQLASYYQERNKHKEAIVEFKKIISIDPDSVKAYNGVGVSFDTLGYTYRAIDYYKKALSVDPEQHYVLNNLGYAYIRLGKYKEAIDALKKAIALNNHKKLYHNNLGLAYVREGLFELALIEFTQGGDEAQAHYNLGRVYYEKGMYDHARSEFLKSLNLEPSYVVAKSWFDLADAKATNYSSSVENVVISEKTDQSRHMSVNPVSEVMTSTDEIENSDTGSDLSNGNQEAISIQSDKKKKNKGATREKISSVVSENRKDNHAIQRKKIIESDSVKRMGIEISNGSGVTKMARNVGDYLSKKGFDVVKLSNANNFNHSKTVVYYEDGQLQTAYKIIEDILGYHDMGRVQNRVFDQSNIVVKVIIGQDIAQDNKFFAGR